MNYNWRNNHFSNDINTGKGMIVLEALDQMVRESVIHWNPKFKLRGYTRLRFISQNLRAKNIYMYLDLNLALPHEFK